MASRKLEVVFVGDTKDFDRAVNRMGASAGKTESKLSKMGRVLRGALAAGAGAAAVGIAKSIKAASDLDEQLNKTAVVFGRSGKRVHAWSKTTAGAFGISRRAALEAAGTFGNMLVPMGFARKEAARMSTGMVELAADMASFNNASPEETLEAIRAGLAGETEPLRRFGVFLNDARLKQEALNLGLKDAIGPNGALTANAKAQATYSLLLKDTKDAQGDFARTSDSLANQQRILKARAEDLAASFGKFLIPATNKALGGLVDFIAAAQTFVPQAGQKIKAFVQGAGFDFGKFGQDATTVWNDIKAAVVALTPVFEFFLAVVRRVLPGVRMVFEGFVQMVKGAVQVIAGVLTLDFGKAMDGLRNIFGGALQGMVGMLRVFTAPMREAAAVLGGAVIDGIHGLVGAIVGLGSWIVHRIADGVRGVAGVIAGAAGWIKDRYVEYVHALVGSYLAVGRWIVTRVMDGAKAVAGVVASAASWLRSHFVEFVHNGFSSFLSLGSWIVGRIAGGVRTAAEAVASAASWIKNRVVEFVHDAAGDLLGLGRWIVTRIKAGIVDAPLSLFKDAAEWLKDKIVGAVKSVLGIKSPSRVFAELGRFAVQGFVKGMEAEDALGFIRKHLGGVADVAGALVKKGLIDLPLKLLFKGGELVGKIFGGGDSPWPGFSLVQLGKMLQKAGFAVGEHPAFGGVQGRHSKGSYHYQGRALDINADNAPGGEKRALDALYGFLKKLPHAELLWQVKDHFDHLHFAMRDGGVAPGGLVRVGELGPELAVLPKGTRVYPASRSAGMEGGPLVHIEHATFNEPTDADRLAVQLGWQIATR